jgi:hypothetical protein
MGGAHVTYGRDEKCMEIPEGSEPLGKPRGRWEDDIEMKMNATGRKPWTDFIWLRTETIGDNESANFIKGGVTFYYLQIC